MSPPDAATGAAAARRDEPLRGRPHPHDRLHPAMYGAEFAGTALLVLAGLSVVVAVFGEGTPLASLVPAPGPRRALAGFLFGAVGASVAFSPLGRISGAHINPAVTLAFWLEGKIGWRDAVCYALAQFAGAAAGAVALLAWGAMGASVGFGTTLPAAGVPVWWAVLGEAACTWLLVTLIFVMAANRATRPFTPLINPPLFSLLVWLEAPLSGTSANPARSFGPALVTGSWHQQWVYVVGPCLGAAVAVAVLRSRIIGHHRPQEARLHHFASR